MKGLLFTYLLTYGGAVASLFDPFIGLLIYVCFAIIKPEAMWFWSVPEGNYSRIVAFGLLAGWLFKGFGNWSFGAAKPIVFALIGYMGWMIIASFHAINQAHAFHFVEASAKIVLPFLVGITTIDSVKRLKQLAWVIILSQGYVALELNLSYYHGDNKLFQEGFAGMDNNSVCIGMVACVGPAFFLGLRAEGLWRKALAFGSALLMAHTPMFGFSRGGMLALAATGCVAFWLIPKRPVYYLVFALAIALGLRLAGPEVRERFSQVFAKEGERDESAQSRIELWKACLDSMKQRPLLGVGPDNWGDVVQEYGFHEGKQAHSLWMQIGAELGLPGLACLVLFYGYTILRLWPLTRAGGALSDPWLQDAARMVIAALIGFGVAAQFVSLTLLEAPFYLVLIGAGALKVQALDQANARLEWEGWPANRPAPYPDYQDHA